MNFKQSYGGLREFHGRNNHGCSTDLEKDQEQQMADRKRGRCPDRNFLFFRFSPPPPGTRKKRESICICIQEKSFLFVFGEPPTTYSVYGTSLSKLFVMKSTCHVHLMEIKSPFSTNVHRLRVIVVFVARGVLIILVNIPLYYTVSGNLDTL